MERPQPAAAPADAAGASGREDEEADEMKQENNDEMDQVAADDGPSYRSTNI